jgi:hypothetical protein
MMGDNRDASLDARFFGFVPETHIVGSPMFIWLSLQGTFDEGPKKVRWERMFKATNTGEKDKTSLIEALKKDKVFDSFGNSDLENLKLFFESGINYSTFKSDVAKFWFKGIYEEIKFSIQEKLDSYDIVIKNTYDDIFPKEYGNVRTTEDIYKIREDYWDKIKMLREIFAIQEENIKAS